MSIETRVQQSDGDILPEGREPDGRQNAPTQTSYDGQVPDQPEGDALPLDGTLTLNDTEPQDQTERRPDGPRILSGSEAGGTANASIEGGGGAADAISTGDPATTSATANADPSTGQTATGGQ